MPLTFVKSGDHAKILKINGKDDTRRFLNALGFVEGADLSVITEINGDLIVKIKDARVAINKTMANRIIV